MMQEYDFYFDAPIRDNKFGQHYVKKFHLPRFKQINKIIIKIKYKDNISQFYDITKAIKSIQLYIGSMLVDDISNTHNICANNQQISTYDDYTWTNNNELLINCNFKYSNGTIIPNECKYFDITLKIEQYDYYYVESTKCILLYEE